MPSILISVSLSDPLQKSYTLCLSVCVFVCIPLLPFSKSPKTWTFSLIWLVRRCSVHMSLTLRIQNKMQNIYFFILFECSNTDINECESLFSVFPVWMQVFFWSTKEKWIKRFPNIIRASFTIKPHLVEYWNTGRYLCFWFHKRLFVF